MYSEKFQVDRRKAHCDPNTKPNNQTDHQIISHKKVTGVMSCKPDVQRGIRRGRFISIGVEIRLDGSPTLD